jgi:Putative auto-transporter adhesin, head GIN domain
MQHLRDFAVFYWLFIIIKTVVMKNIVFAVLSMISVLAVNAQSGEKNVQKRPVTGFHGVDVSGGIDLYLSNGPESVAVSASSNDVRDHIVTEVVGGILRIHMESNWNQNMDNAKMKAFVSLNNLKNLEGSGGGDIVFENLIKGEDLDVRLSGGGSLRGKLNVNHLVINQSGGSEVKLSGNVQNLTLNASGGGSLNGFDLITDYASIRASGGSETELTVNKELRAVVSGGGDITYKGAASVKEIKSSGGGSVTHKD